ncbi:MAG: hypothetical protein Q7J57_11670 [Gemmobacter sp.]|nr:hypothetical protein [Gemmobacter sp.]
MTNLETMDKTAISFAIIEGGGLVPGTHFMNRALRRGDLLAAFGCAAAMTAPGTKMFKRRYLRVYAGGCSKVAT